MAAAHVLLHWNNNLGYFRTLYLRLFLNQVVLIWIAHIRMTQLVVGTRVKYSVYGGKKRGEYYGAANIIISSVAISIRSPSFVALSPVTDCILRWEEQVVTSRISPPALGWCWLHLATRVCCPVPSSGPPTRGINDASPQSCSCTTFKYPHHQLHLCSTAACSLQPPVANFLCRYLINAFGQYYFGWERAVKLPHFPSTIARHSFYIFHNPQCTQSYASNEPLNVGWEWNKIPVDKVNHLLVSLSQFPQSWLEFVRVYPARC